MKFGAVPCDIIIPNKFVLSSLHGELTVLASTHWRRRFGRNTLKCHDALPPGGFGPNFFYGSGAYVVVN